ncbi:roadblock/LC7 domain-containing protein, partial [Kitasatospora sp. NPDC058190]|uniref:roadblock/LC7 domain-containing protein n=1 Tax=Kitasatospora sp. NPDC058190 TaxID=3346371 RepID=UPI0036DAA568
PDDGRTGGRRTTHTRPDQVISTSHPAGEAHLKLCHTAGLSADQADQLAAIASGLQSLAHGASIEFGDGSGGVRQSMTEFHGGILCIVAAGEGAHLAVVTDDDADVGVVGHNMHGLIEQIGVHLNAPARSAEAATQESAGI